MVTKRKTSIFHTLLVCFGLIAVVLLGFVGVVYGNQNKQPQKNISVILYYFGENSWQSLEQGINQAQKDFAVNVNYVILHNYGDAAEQMEAMENEASNGADGILIAAVNGAELHELWQEKKLDIPVVAIENDFNEPSVPLIAADDYEMGKTLGKAIMEDFSGKEMPVIAIDLKESLRKSVNNRKQGFLDSIEGKASVITIDDVLRGTVADAAVALDKESLLTLANSENTLLSAVKKYGIGNSASIVAALEHDQIEKIVFQNEFNMGYMAVETLMNKIRGTKAKEQEQIEFYCVGVKDIYDAPYERLLFPIVE